MDKIEIQKLAKEYYDSGRVKSLETKLINEVINYYKTTPEIKNQYYNYEDVFYESLAVCLQKFKNKDGNIFLNYFAVIFSNDCKNENRKNSLCGISYAPKKLQNDWKIVRELLNEKQLEDNWKNICLIGNEFLGWSKEKLKKICEVSNFGITSDVVILKGSKHEISTLDIDESEKKRLEQENNDPLKKIIQDDLLLLLDSAYKKFCNQSKVRSDFLASILTYIFYDTILYKLTPKQMKQYSFIHDWTVQKCFESNTISQIDITKSFNMDKTYFNKVKDRFFKFFKRTSGRNIN